MGSIPTVTIMRRVKRTYVGEAPAYHSILLGVIPGLMPWQGLAGLWYQTYLRLVMIPAVFGWRSRLFRYR